MQVIALVRRTIDGVAREPGGKPFDLEIEADDPLILEGVVADANAPAPEPEARPEPIDHPVGYVGKQSSAEEAPVLEPEPVSTEFPAPNPAEATVAVAPVKKIKGAPRA